MKLGRTLAVLGVLLLALATAPPTEGRLRKAEYSRAELESIDLFLVLLLRIARWALAVSLALPVAVPLVFDFAAILLN